MGDAQSARVAPPAPPSVCGTGTEASAGAATGEASTSSWTHSRPSPEAEAENKPSMALSTEHGRRYSQMALERKATVMLAAQQHPQVIQRRARAQGCSAAFAKVANALIGSKKPSVALPKGHGALTAAEQLKDPTFVDEVYEMMQEDSVVEVFSRFDTDASGTVDATEISTLIAIFAPNCASGDASDLIRELDINRDGVIDLWEFCVQMQLQKLKRSRDDAVQEVDMAFTLFATAEDGTVSSEELRRIFMLPSGGTALSSSEFDELLLDLGIRDGGRVSLQKLRQHPCFQVM